MRLLVGVGWCHHHYHPLLLLSPFPIVSLPSILISLPHCLPSIHTYLPSLLSPSLPYSSSLLPPAVLHIVVPHVPFVPCWHWCWVLVPELLLLSVCPCCAPHHPLPSCCTPSPSSLVPPALVLSYLPCHCCASSPSPSFSLPVISLPIVFPPHCLLFHPISSCS